MARRVSLAALGVITSPRPPSRHSPHKALGGLRTTHPRTGSGGDRRAGRIATERHHLLFHFEPLHRWRPSFSLQEDALFALFVGRFAGVFFCVFFSAGELAPRPRCRDEEDKVLPIARQYGALGGVAVRLRNSLFNLAFFMLSGGGSSASFASA